MATISINAVLGEDGLIKQAEKASQMQANAEAADNEAMDVFDKYISGAMEKNDKGELNVKYDVEDIDVNAKVVKLSYFINVGEVTAEDIEAKIVELTGMTITDEDRKEAKQAAEGLGITYEEFLLEMMLQQSTGETISEDTRDEMKAEAAANETTYQKVLEYLLDEYAGISFSESLISTEELEEMVVEATQGEITFDEESRKGYREQATNAGMTYKQFLKAVLEAYGIDTSGATTEVTIGNTNIGVAKSEFIATRNGTYTVKVTANNGMKTETKIEVTGIEEEKFSNIYQTTQEYTDANGDKAKIPAGFAVGTSDGINTIDGGLVITDAVDNEGYSIGNEFVWIPVESNETFIRDFNDGSGNETVCTEPFNYTKNGTTYTGYTNEETEYNTMRTKVLEHHGFYIGRYEAGVNNLKFRKEETEAQKVVSKRGVAPYNYVKWGDSMNDIGTNGAVYLAQNMYTGKAQANSVTSTLCYGVQWDQMCRYIEDSTRTTPTKWSLDLTGRVGGDNSKNIYDLAGNCSEWTMEAYDENKRIARGAFYDYYGVNVAWSVGYNIDDSVDYVSFRCALYIN